MTRCLDRQCKWRTTCVRALLPPNGRAVEVTFREPKQPGCRGYAEAALALTPGKGGAK